MISLPVVVDFGTALPPALRNDLFRGFAQQALSEDTRTAYASAWRAFEKWCRNRDVAALVASPASVAGWLAAMAERGLRPATIARRCAAVGHFHRLAGIDPLPTNAAVAKATMAGLRRALGAAPSKKAPATADVAKTMADATSVDSVKGRRDRAMIRLGFAGAFRKSEVVAVKVEDLEFVDEGVRVTIRRSKTDQEPKGQTIAILRGAGPFCPVKLLRKRLDAATITEGVLFRQTPQSGKRAANRIAGRIFYDVVKRGVAAIGLDAKKFGSHSMRAGWMTTAAGNGANIFKMKEVSRHKSTDTLSGYIREAKLFDQHASIRTH